MSDDDIGVWLDVIVQQTKEQIETYDKDEDTTQKARNLIEQWAKQSDGFREIYEKPKKDTKTDRKVVLYRKMDTPMMVAKKMTSNRPSVDPTLIMEARREHLNEMKAERIKRAEEKKKEKNQNPILQPPKHVDVPNVDNEINGYRSKVKQKLDEKQKELEERRRKSIQIKKIEESAALSIANEEKSKIRSTSNDPKYDTESLKLRIQLLHAQLRFRNIRNFFVMWTTRCSFQSKAFHSAQYLSNFHRISGAYSYWRSRTRNKIHSRELDRLEERLRREKQLETTANHLYTRNAMFKSITKWKSRYREIIEFKIIEEQHRKRREVLINRISRSPPKQQISDCIPQRNKAEEKPKQAKPIQVDPKFVAMEKRNEEKRMKMIEKAQKEAQASEAAESERLKIEIEEDRKKKLEHRQFLEMERNKREEQKKRVEEFERKIQRKKYCQHVSVQFREKCLKSRLLGIWKLIIVIRKQQEFSSENTYLNKLKFKALKAIKNNQVTAELDKDQYGLDHFNCRLLRFSLLSWFSVVNQTKEKGLRTQELYQKTLQKNILSLLRAIRRKRIKKRILIACTHYQRNLLKRVFKGWPEGCAIVIEEEKREEERQNLLKRALSMLNSLSDSDIE